MEWLKKKPVKYTLAVLGVVYLLLAAGYLAYIAFGPSEPTGPSDLEANPERQAEILAQRRADELKQQVGLNDEQTKKVKDIIAAQGAGSPDGDFRAQWRATRDEIAKVLTPEQQAKMEADRQQFRGGPMSNMTPERIEKLKQNMSPELQARFDARIKQWQQRRGQRGGGPRGAPQQQPPQQPAQPPQPQQ